MADKTLRITLTAWRQAGPDAAGGFETYDVPGVSPDMSFLEMLDTVNERLILDGKEPIAFDHDCREGICGSCGMMINGVPHGPERGTDAYGNRGVDREPDEHPGDAAPRSGTVRRQRPSLQEYPRRVKSRQTAGARRVHVRHQEQKSERNQREYR